MHSRWNALIEIHDNNCWEQEGVVWTPRRKQAAADVTEFLEILSAASDTHYQSRHLMQLDLNLNLSVDKIKDVPNASRLVLLYKTAVEPCLVGIKMDDELLQKINAFILEYLKWFQKESLPGEH